MKPKASSFILLALLFINSNCSSFNSTTANDDSHPDKNEDKACRQTIQKLYSIETYCPDNLPALQSLFTDEFNKQNKPSLERCNQVSSYDVLTLLSEDDPNFLDSPNDPKSLDVIEYFAKIDITSESGNALGNTPSSIWLHMKVLDSGDCKIDNIHGGG